MPGPAPGASRGDYGDPVRRLILTLAGGGLLCLAFPTFDIWVAAPLALALMAWAWTGAGARRGALLGLVAGLAFFLPSLHWSGIYVGALPWVALSSLEALFIALAGALYGWLSRSGRVRPLAFALVWVVAEGLRARLPYGGFPWLKLAFGQADSPFGPLVALGGAPFVGFVLAVSGALLALGLTSRGMPLGRRLVPAALAVGLGTAGLLVPLPTDGTAARFVGVQGNVPKAGLDFNAQRRAVLDNHVQATFAVADAVTTGQEPRPDLVVWPENASDIDPVRNADAASLVTETVDALEAPLVVGTLLEGPGQLLSNVSLLYEPGKGIVDRYVKQHPVPFAEYIPNRSFWRKFSKQVDLVGRDFTAGSGSGVFTVPAASGGSVKAGIAICFEVAYDDIMRDTVRAGANVLVVQTNNATFGFTAESPQQLAISRVRAMEFGRSVLHVSTVGQSALITPDGTAHQVTSLFTQAVVRGDLPLRDETTVATRVGEAPEWAAAAALLVLVGTRIVAPETRRRRTTRIGTDRRDDLTKDEDDDDEA